MYILDTENNKIIQALPCTFSSKKLKERANLQEWIAKEPNSLGEDLLIIQKEFAGFEKTKERLDLLAIDKLGNLVVIENKIDDSGKDVTWQALKYASYCASLKKEDIIQIYQKYLDSYCNGGNAKMSIVEFFGKNDIDDISLNEGDTNLRIVLVAGTFPIEVTSTVLWLRNNFGLQISCVEVTPYTYNGKIILDFNQIIPVKGTEEYTIKLAEKKKDEDESKVHTAKRYGERVKFWDAFIAYNKQHGGLYAESKSTTDSWMGKGGIGISGMSVNSVITQGGCRVEVYFNFGDRDTNKDAFDFFHNHKDEIESEISNLKWQRLDERVTCRVYVDLDKSYQDPNNQEEIFDFLITNTERMIKVFSKVGKGYKH